MKMNETTPKDKKTRIEYIDLAKGMCIFLVVLFHLTSKLHIQYPLNEYMILFRMPLYFFLSGCFFKPYDGFFDFLKRKTNKLLIPFFFAYLFFSYLIPSLVYHVLGWNWGLLSLERLPIAWLHTDYPNIAIWFLLCLFEMNIIFYVSYWISQKTKSPLAALVVCTIIMAYIGYELNMHSIKLPCKLNKAFTAQPYFLVGYITLRHSNILKPNKTDRFLPIIIVACFGLLAMFKAFSEELGVFSPYLCGIFGTYGIILLAKLLKWLPSFSYFGRYSIMILISHIMVYLLYVTICRHFGLPNGITFCITIVATWCSYYLIIPFLRRFMPYVTAQKDIIPVGDVSKKEAKEKQ